MGRQVGFYAIDEDYAGLLRRFEEEGLLAIPPVIPTDTVPQRARPTEFQLPRGTSFFYLMPEDAPVAEALYMEGETDVGRSWLLPHVSPVIQCVPCQREGDVIRNGRIYFDTQATMLTGAPRPWHGVISRKYDKLAREIKRWPETDQFRFHIGPHTAEQARDGRIRLMHFSHELRVM